MDKTNEVIAEIAAKIIGGGRFFDSLAEALRAFLSEEIGRLKILGDISIEFSRSKIEILKGEGEFDEFFIEAPVISLKTLGWNKKMTDIPNFSSLTDGFEDFWQKRIQSLQIYEQRCQKGSFIHLFTNYMVIFSWDEQNPQVILFHIHNIDTEQHFWGEKFVIQKAEEEIVLLPVLVPYQGNLNFSKN